MVERYAQTNLQLYAQLRSSGYTDEDLTRIHRTYELAIALFSASFRGSGKPLIAHLVGTASILASISEAARVVSAGLVHAAYALGDFGTGRAGITAAKRARVRRAVGADVEELVARYTRFAWNRETIPLILAGVTTLEPIERDVLVIRLANELEDHLDLGVLYCQNAESRREYIRSPLNQSAAMAGQLGLAQLAAALETAFSDVLSASVPPSLRNSQGYTFLQPPASHRLRPIVVMRRFVDRHPALGLPCTALLSMVARVTGRGQRVAPVLWKLPGEAP